MWVIPGWKIQRNHHYSSERLQIYPPASIKIRYGVLSRGAALLEPLRNHEGTPDKKLNWTREEGHCLQTFESCMMRSFSVQETEKTGHHESLP